MITLQQTISLNNYFIEIHHNDLIKKNPYLVRIFNYDSDIIEIRATQEQLDKFLKDIGENYGEY